MSTVVILWPLALDLLSSLLTSQGIKSRKSWMEHVQIKKMKPPNGNGPV